eukprot:GSA25T00020434001.1
MSQEKDGHGVKQTDEIINSYCLSLSSRYYLPLIGTPGTSRIIERTTTQRF